LVFLSYFLEDFLVLENNTITRIVRKIPPILIIGDGLAVIAVGCGMLIQIDTSTSFLFLSIELVISSLGLAPVFTLTTDLVVEPAPTEPSFYE
jgi:MFS transporter, DHA2 family, multidrug resistance protein